MNTTHLLALTASVAFNAAGLFVLAPRAGHVVQTAASIRATEINGLEVVDLPTIEVHPSAQDLRDASADVGPATSVLSTLARHADLIGAQLTMPYYSFGTEFGRISKE